jgi:hypothetical protein
VNPASRSRRRSFRFRHKRQTRAGRHGCGPRDRRRVIMCRLRPLAAA